MASDITVSESALTDFVVRLFEHAGLSAAHARTVADSLVWADLRGVDTHGVSRVGQYLSFIKSGVISTAPVLRVRNDTVAMQVLDADRAPGAVAMGRAVDTAMEKARVAGVGVVLVSGTTHNGALGYYTQRLARQGMVGIAYAASSPMMAYHGARAAGVSTAPLSIAAPGAGDDPVVLDMASASVSLGELREAKRRNETLAEGRALDAQGNPTTDPQQALIPLPMAGAKGSGLSLMFELITSVLTMNPIIAEFFSGKPGARRHQQNACVIAFDAFRFSPEETFRADVARTVAALKSLPSADESIGILMPGERGHRIFNQRRQSGVPVSGAVAKELATLAEAAGIAPPFQ